MQVYSMLAANLCMGWIDQLVQDSFAWRTHLPLLAPFFLECLLLFQRELLAAFEPLL